MVFHNGFGAFVPDSAGRVAGRPAGSLGGLTFAVKDLIDVANEVTGGGNPDWHRTHEPATRHAPAVESLLDAGADLVGKTITDELAFSLEGANAHYGTPTNPRAPDRLPGGSSSGSAVAVAAGLVDFALGTDTGGSVRVPASFCGIFGFRPTHGRVSLDGVIPFAPSYDTIGWFAREAGMLARIGRVLLDRRQATPPLRLVLARDAFDLCDPGCTDALLSAARKLAIDGEIAVFGGEEALWQEAYSVLQGGEIWSSLGSWIVRTKPRFGAAIAPRFASVASITEDQVRLFAPIRQRIRATLDRLIEPDVGLVLPTAPGIAPLKTRTDAETASFYRQALTLSSVAGHAGLPQIAMPVAAADRHPLGLSVVGSRGSDEALLALAEALAG